MSKVIITLDRNFGSKSIHSDDSSVAADLVFLTELELASLMTIALCGMDCMGGKKPSDLLEDNMSWFNQTDIMNGTGCSTMAARGVMTFLGRKGLAMDNETGRRGALPKNDDGSVKDHWALTDAGINAAQHAWWAARNQQLDADMVARRPALSRVIGLVSSNLK